MPDINPWVRANIGQYNTETLELIPTDKRKEYRQVMFNLAFCGQLLVDAQADYQEAEQERNEFFRGLAYE